MSSAYTAACSAPSVRSQAVTRRDAVALDLILGIKQRDLQFLQPLV